LLVPDPDPEAPLPAQTPVAATPAENTGTPPAEGAATDLPPASAPVGGEDGGQGNREKERRQEVWPVFAAGATTTVAGGPLNVRVEPGLWAAILTALPDGYAVTVLAGPVESDGIAWYQIMTPESVAGWCDGSYLVSA
jgi:hypothetical protein